MLHCGRWLTLALGFVLAGVVLAQKDEDEKSEGTGSELTAKEAEALLKIHNKARKEVDVPPVKWSNKIASYAQEWADQIAETGEIKHRPPTGKWARKYGENLAFHESVVEGAELWYAEIKDYTPGTPIPRDFSRFKAGHYTQMVWKKTKEIGAGKAVIRQGPFKGLLAIVCNYNPAGNFVGEKPY